MLPENHDLQQEALLKVCDCAVEAIAQIEEWLGSASTRQAAEESIYRLRRALQRAGYEMKNGCLEYRGSILRAMEHAGIGMDDEGVIRIRRRDACLSTTELRTGRERLRPLMPVNSKQVIA